jgi:hypothetical protein
MDDKYTAKAQELHRAYFLGAYTPADDAGNVAAIAQALREAAAEAYRHAAECCMLGAEATFISEAVRADRKRTAKLLEKKAAALRAGR